MLVEKTSQVAQELTGSSKTFTFDPLTILSLIGIIIQIIKTIQSCHPNNPANGLKEMQQRSLVRTVMLRKILRKQQAQNIDLGELEFALRKIGATLTASDVDVLYQECSSARAEDIVPVVMSHEDS